MTVEGDASVAPVVASAVKSGVLEVSSKGSFKTQQPIKVIVRWVREVTLHVADCRWMLLPWCFLLPPAGFLSV